MFKYRKAFKRNDSDRYEDFINRVEKGEAVLKTGTLYPYNVISPMFMGGGVRTNFSLDERRVLNSTWNSLEDFTGEAEGHGRNALVVCDVSLSMFRKGSPSPIEVATSLSIYFAERNKGAFKNHFITFHKYPRLVKIEGKDIVDKVDYLSRAEWGGTTNIEGVFDLILETAVKNHLSQKDMPENIYIISDMEFNCCTSNSGLTNFENARQKFKDAGYNLPNLVFWNVQSRQDNLPVSRNEQGVSLVSGASPRIFSMLKDGNLTPYDYMLSVINSDRYSRIVA